MKTVHVEWVNLTSLRQEEEGGGGGGGGSARGWLPEAPPHQTATLIARNLPPIVVS